MFKTENGRIGVLVQWEGGETFTRQGDERMELREKKGGTGKIRILKESGRGGIRILKRHI